VKLNVEHLVLLGLLTAPTHWIIARSEIARPFWSRLRGFPAKLLACPACSGFWLALVLAAFGVQPVTVLCPSKLGAGIAMFLASGVLGTLVTPIMQAVMLLGLHYSAMPAAPDTNTEAVPEAVPVPNAPEESPTPPPTSPSS
jgi:hypothetical protein